MKVLHVAPSLDPTWGGPVAVLRGLLPALKARGVQSTVLATSGYRVGRNPVSIPGVQARVFSTSPLARLWTSHAFALARALRSRVEAADVVHIHELWHYPHFAAHRVALRSGRPFIVTVHGELEPWALGHHGLRKRVYLNLVQRRALKRAALIHALTEAEEAQVRAVGVQTPVAVVPNGIDIEPYARLEGRTAFRQRHGIPEGARVALFLGRLHRKKGLDILAEAFGEIASRSPNRSAEPFLVVAGPDEAGLADEMRTILQRHGVVDSARFTGMLTGNDRLSALAAADLFVLPSYSEGFSMTVLEAMASGLPVIVSRQCYFPEVAIQGAGLVVESEVSPLRDALSRLLGDPGAGVAFGEAGRALVGKRYTWDAVASEMTEIYEAALGNTRSAEAHP